MLNIKHNTLYLSVTAAKPLVSRTLGGALPRTRLSQDSAGKPLRSAVPVPLLAVLFVTCQMASVVSCILGCCADRRPGHVPLHEMPAVQLDTQHMGSDVVVIKSGRRICGTGGCLSNAPLHQNKSYFEIKIHSMGLWGVGLATPIANLNQIPMGLDAHSLVLRNDGSVYHNNEEKNRLPANSLPQEGDVVGITYDHVDLNLYLNGKNMHCPASGIHGTVFPVVYVDDSAILDCHFSDFNHAPPHGFDKIMFEKQIF